MCIYRMPRGLSVVTPRSACPGCKNPIALYDNMPVLGWLMRSAGDIPVERGDRRNSARALLECARVLRQGCSVVFFPEGTRSPDGRLLLFKKGPFHLAKEAGVPVIPVTILGTGECWPKGTWAVRSGRATLIFHPPIDPANFADRDALMVAVRKQIASALPEGQRGTELDSGEST